MDDDSDVISNAASDDELEDSLLVAQPTQRPSSRPLSHLTDYGDRNSGRRVSNDDSETSPLLQGVQKKGSFSAPLIRSGRRNLEDAPGPGRVGGQENEVSTGEEAGQGVGIGRKLSSASVKSEKRPPGGRSTFGQTVRSLSCLLVS